MQNTIVDILNEYKSYLIENRLSDKKDSINILLMISQIDEYCNDDILYEYFLQSCRDLKRDMENGKTPYPVGMIGGLGQYIFSINEFRKKTGSLIGFNRELHLYYSEYAKNVLKFHAGYKKNAYLNYDVISGAAGILYYLVENRDIVENDEAILYFIGYLSDVRLYVQTNNGDCLVNFGLAHGLAGILTSLCKAYSKGYRLKNQLKKINALFGIYEKFQTTKNGITYFPSILSSEEFNKDGFVIRQEEKAYTWCYGSITILRTLIKSYNYMGNKPMADYYTGLLIDNLSKSVANNKLVVPIICHGYSSVINIVKSSLCGDCLKKSGVENYFINKIIDEIKNETIKKYLYVRFKNDISFLQGFGGVILTLSRYAQNEISFDKLLLID